MLRFHLVLAFVLAFGAVEVVAWFGPIITTIRIGLTVRRFVKWGRNRRRDSALPIPFYGADYLSGHLGTTLDIIDEDHEKVSQEVVERLVNDMYRRQQTGEDEDAAEMSHISGEILFLLCNANEDEHIDFNEFKKCFRGTNVPVSRQQYQVFDKDDDGVLGPEEVVNYDFLLKMRGSYDCYSTLAVDCASRFVMYLRARNATGLSLCGGIQAFDDCIKQKYDLCEDPRMDDLADVLTGAEKRLSTICPEGTETEVTLPMDCIGLETVHCARNLMFDLHTPMAPCVAMHRYDHCVLERVRRCEGEAGGDAMPLFGEYYRRNGPVRCPVPIPIKSDRRDRN